MLLNELMLLRDRRGCSMYVCVCQAVTDREIHQAAKNGAKSLRDLGRDLGVGVVCGRCASCARNCLKSTNEDFLESLPLPATA